MAPRDPHIFDDGAGPGRRTGFVSALLMLAVLTALGLATLADMLDGPGTERDERTATTPAPPLSLAALKAFPGAAKYYVSERYALKQWFIRLNAELKLGLFGHSPYTKVLIGRNGMLLLGDELPVAGLQGAPPPLQRNDAAWLTLFRTMDAAFARRGVPLVQVLAPDKSTVHPETLPDWLVPSPIPRLSRLVAQMQNLTNPAPVDLARLFASIRATDPEVQLYHRTDTHWTELGAALAMDAALAPLLEPAPGLPPLDVQTVPEAGGDLARMIGRQAAIRDTAPHLLRPPGLSCTDPMGKAVELVSLDPLPLLGFTCHNSAAPAGYALVFMDSFGMAAAPRLAQIFRKVDFVWNDIVDMALVDDLDPDLAIRIMVARKLQSTDPAGLLQDK